MIRKFFSRPFFIFSTVLALGVLLSSCLKDNEDIPQNPVAALMAFNLATDQDAVQVELDGNLLPGGSLAFGSYTGQYLNVFPGNRLIHSFNAATTESLDSTSFGFEGENFYSLFVVGNNGNYSNIVVEDNYDTLTASSGKAYVRFVNGLSNAPESEVTIQSAGSSVVNTSAAFGNVSSFVAVDPGDITISVSNEGAVDVDRTIQVQQSRAYTILLAGLPNDPDPNKTAQIRYIENGTVTD